MTKICTKCGIEKDIDEFGLNSGKKDGHYCYCKKCKHIIDKKYRDLHKEKINEYHQINKEKINEHTKKYYQINKGKKIEYSRKYRQDLKDSYVRKLIIARNGLKKEDIPSKMVDLYKILVLIYRESKKINQGVKL